MHLRRKLAEIESLGGEWLMLRKPDSAYTVGRSYDLLKVKTFKDEEATVIKHLPGSGKHAGRLGALLVELPNGIQFAIGTGFTDQERENPPPVGSMITFKYYGFHESGIPRFASFLRVREAFYQLTKKEDHHATNTLHHHSIILTGVTGLCGQWYYQCKKFT